MVPHTYLEHGLSVLNARLRNPMAPAGSGPHADVRPFVTLSRETGAGATTLGRELVPFLERHFGNGGASWVFLDRDLLNHALTRHQLPTRLAQYLPEDRISEIRAFIGELVGLHPSLWQLEQKVSEAILQLAHLGHVIFAGRAAHLVTQSLPGGLHVRLVAPLDTRVRRVAALMACGLESAAEHIARNDEARQRFVRTNFGKDIANPHLYDLVINTDRITPATAAQLVVTALRERVAQAKTQAAVAH